MKAQVTIGLVLTLISSLFFLDLGFLPDFLDPLYSLAHIGFFFVASVLVLTSSWVNRLRANSTKALPQFVAVIGMTLLLGGAVEGLQYFTGRESSLKDLGLDLIGALLGFVFCSKPAQSSSWTLALGQRFAALALVIWASFHPLIDSWDMWLASRQFPVLSDFETTWQARRWSRGDIDHSIARSGKASLKVQLTTARYSGTTLLRSVGDWSGYQTLHFSIYNPAPEPLPLTLSIRDADHFERGTHYDDRFNQAMTIEPGWNDFEFAIDTIMQSPAKRSMKRDSIEELLLFSVELTEPRAFYLDDVMLCRQGCE